MKLTAQKKCTYSLAKVIQNMEFVAQKNSTVAKVIQNVVFVAQKSSHIFSCYICKYFQM